MIKETIKDSDILSEFNKVKGECFQIIKTEGEILFLKGEKTGKNIKIQMSDIFRGIENGEIKLKKKSVPAVKIDKRKKTNQKTETI